MQLHTIGRSALLSICFAALLGASGCAKKTMYGAVKFESNPPGAEVINLKDDASLGVSPVVVTWETSDGAPQYVTVQIRKSGYLEGITSFWVNTRHESREEAQNEAQPVFVELQQRK